MEATDLKISKETQQFIRCLDSLNKQWDAICDALALLYGVPQAEIIMQDRVNESFGELKNIVQGFLIESIDDKMSEINFKEI